MRLAGQLLAISAVTLLLPWAGCEYAREVESALRRGEEQAALSSARLLAAALAPAGTQLAAPPGRWGHARPWGLDFYVHPLDQAPVLDGYVEDWGEVAERIDPLGGREILVGRHAGFLWLFVSQSGPSRPAGLAVVGAPARLVFPLDAPGGLSPDISGAPRDVRARGAWQPTSQGWQLEARIPAPLLGGRLGLEVLAAGGAALWSSYRGDPGWLTGPSPAAAAALARLAPPGFRVTVTDRAGFILAHHREAEISGGRDEARGAFAALVRRAVGGSVRADPPPEARPGQLSGRHVELAALGDSAARWYPRPGGGGMVAAAAPVPGADGPAAVVVVERDTAAILTLTRGPTRRLLATSLLASLGAAAVLLGYALFLSFRIRRLRDAAREAIGGRGEVAPQLPGAGAGDELGDLARTLGGLLGRVRDYNLYLQGLGGKLAHELRTPLAMVKSSLDNLEAETATVGPWLGRARQGVDRMAALVSALAAARRIEQAIAAADSVRFDLAAQVQDMVHAWRGLHPTRQFALARPEGPCPLDGSPDLIAQLLDKLVENAVDFTPPGGEIAVALQAADGDWRLSVANPGSRLPSGPPERLFDSLVSERSDAGEGAHLGLGLFVVRLIAAHHGGRVSARNLSGSGGVEFAVELPRAAA